MRVTLATLLCLVVTPIGAAERYGTFLSGEKLYGACRTDPDGALNYVVGVMDAAAALKTSGYCTDPLVGPAQARDVVCKSLALNPETRHHPAAALSIAAIGGAFCAQYR